MDKKVVERLEELVEKISGCYASIPKEILNELNVLTQNEWSEEKYIEYCAEYWSSNTLEETVYALLHDGEYPNKVEEDLYFWKTEEVFDLSDKQVMRRLRKLPESVDKEFIDCFEDLPVKETYQWLCSYFSDWHKNKEISKEDILNGFFEVIFNCNSIEEYAIFKYVVLEDKANKLIRIDCCNLSKSEKQDILAFAKQYNLHIYEQ